MFSTRTAQTASRVSSVVVLSLLAMALLSLPATAQKVDVTNLTSDISAAAAFNDPNLVNPWGLSISPSGPWWVSDNTSGLSTLYNSTGAPQGLVVTIPSGSGSGTGTRLARFTTPPAVFKFTVRHSVPLLHGRRNHLRLVWR